MRIFFYYFVFPGMLFSILLGIFASWFERKITARIQWRVGPPLLQPLYDVLKLFSKETVIPERGSEVVFILSPIISFVVSVFVATLVGIAQFYPEIGFQGDLIVVVYFLTIPSLCIILGGASSSNPLASLGASREMKLVLSYEIIFWCSVAVVWIKTNGLLKLSNIIHFQTQTSPVIYSISGFIAFVLAFITALAKLGRVPFDIAEAETEITGGPYIDYSGALLGFFKLSQYVLLVAVPFLLCELFLGGVNVLKYIIILILIILVENTNPRLKITQFLWFAWIVLFPISLIAIILAIKGL